MDSNAEPHSFRTSNVPLLHSIASLSSPKAADLSSLKKPDLVPKNPDSSFKTCHCGKIVELGPIASPALKM